MGPNQCDNFQYEGTLSKFERGGLGENVDADEEEGKEEVFKVGWYAARGSDEASVEAELEFRLRGNESTRGRPGQL